MFNKITSKFFGSSNDREINKFKPIVSKINELEKELMALSDNQLKSKTIDFKYRLSKG